MGGRKKHDEARLWKEIGCHVKFGEPAAPMSKFLSGHRKVLIEGGVSTLTTQMKDFLLDAAEKFRIEAGAERLAKVSTPYLDEGFAAKGTKGPGVFAGSASSTESPLRSSIVPSGFARRHCVLGK